MGGVYVPVPDKVWSYEDLAQFILEIQGEVKDRLLKAAGLDEEAWDALYEGEQEDIAIRHSYDIFSIGPSYHAALLNAVDDYYSLIKGINNDIIRETAMSFIPNVENYTVIFSNIIAATMK